jgi:protein ImuB
MIGRQGSKRLILAVDDNAASLGLRVGMAVSKAQALVPGLVIMDADPVGDAEALERMALWALQQYSPVVAADPPDGIIIDTAGADHLHGGEVAMLEQMRARFTEAGIAARLAISDQWGASHAHARFSQSDITIVEPGQHRQTLPGLPVAALRISGETVRALRVLGFDTIGELIRQPRAPLALRFGPDLGRRLDQALGLAAEPIEPIRPTDLIEVRKVFGEPISATETIVRYIGKLVVALCAELEPQGLGARRLDLLIHRVDSAVQAIRVGTALPTRNIKQLTRLLTDRMGKIDPGFGIEIMTLAAAVAEPLDFKQVISSLVEEPEADVSALVDILTNRLGDHRLYRFSAVASDVPERMVTKVPPMAPESETLWPDHWPRPVRLFGRPEPIETLALLPDHPPVSFTWRGVRHRIRRADGPERVFGEWWRRDAELIAVRDYFQVEDDAGERFWIFRAGDGEDANTGSHQWFIHGLFG